LSGTVSVPFKVTEDSVVVRFVSDRTLTGNGNWTQAYLSSDPSNPGGFADDSITDQQLLIADKGSAGDVLLKGVDYFIHPGQGGLSVLIQLTLEPIRILPS